MSEINSSNRHGPTRGPLATWPGRIAALSIAGMGATFAGLLLSPFAQADSSTATAESYLLNNSWAALFESPNAMPDSVTTAYGDLGVMWSDASDTFAKNFADDIQMWMDMETTLFDVGTLAEGAIGDVSDIAGIVGKAANPAAALPADAIPPSQLPDPSQYEAAWTGPTADVNPADDTTASQFFTGIENMAQMTTASLTNIQASVAGDSILNAPGDNDVSETQVINDLIAFQEQINASLNAMPSMSSYDDNGVLNLALQGLLTDEINMNHWAINLDENVVLGSASGLAADNGDLIGSANGVYDYSQDVVNFLNFEDMWKNMFGWL